VPVKQQTSATRCSLVPSTKALLAYSKHIHSFLSLPLIPLELSNNGLFTELKRRGLIQEVDYDIIKRTISTSVLLSTEFIELLRWFCSIDVIDNKEFIESIFLTIRFRDYNHSQTITLEKIKYYDEFDISPILPLSSNVLPTRIAVYISNDNLTKQLSLTALALDDLLNFYFLEDHKFLLTDRNKIICLFNLISRYWTDIQTSRREQMKTTLSKLECIPTEQGMKLPKESYIRSRILSPDLPIIILNVVEYMNQQHNDGVRIGRRRRVQLNDHSDDRVSTEFLKCIGCRTVHVRSFIAHQNNRSNTPQSIKENFLTFIEYLINVCRNMSEEDIEALKGEPCFAGQ
jgi:hypothetical protein